MMTRGPQRGNLTSSGQQSATKVSCECWDAFVRDHPEGHFEQTSLWAEVKSAYGWSSLRFIERPSPDTRVGAQVLVRRFPILGRIGYIQSGPILTGEAAGLGRMAAHLLLDFARRERLTYLVVNPPVPGPDIHQANR